MKIQGIGWNGSLDAVHTHTCVRLTDGFTCAGSDLPLQERYQAGTLEVSILLRDNEPNEGYNCELDSMTSSSGAYGHVVPTEDKHDDLIQCSGDR
jgi:hypothetical protein